MQFQKLLTELLTVDSIDCWENERTASALRALAVRLHSTGLSLRETAIVLECFGVSRSHQAIWYWVHQIADSTPDPPSVTPTQVAVDETAVQVGTEWYWLYAAIDLDSKLLLGVRLSQRRETSLAAAFLRELEQQHDLSNTEFLVDGFGYLTALARTDLSGALNYVRRNKIEKWFQTLKMWVRSLSQHLDRQQPALRAGSLPSPTIILDFAPILRPHRVCP